MIEVVFGKNQENSLKLAQHFGEGAYQPDGVTAVLLGGPEATEEELAMASAKAEEDLRKEWKSAVPMGGREEDVFGIELGLSVGDISEKIPGQARLAALGRLTLDASHAQEMLTQALRSLRTILERSAKGEAVRIWYSSEPDETCGLYWMLSQLAQLEEDMGPVSVVRLPQFEQISEETVPGARLNKLIQRSGWGDVAPGEWHRFVQYEIPLSTLLVQFAAGRWERLQQENAPLRAVLNGRLTSAPADLYDVVVRAELSKMQGEFSEVLLIANVLQNQLGIGDAQIAERIEALIANGEIEVTGVPASEKARWGRTLRRK